MKPERRSQLLLGITRSKAKMYEFAVPEEHHIKIPRDPSRLFTLAIGLLGDLCARINTEGSPPAALDELRKGLRFSAQFFDAYRQSKLNEAADPYVLLIGAATFYLCDLPGSASVLARHLPTKCPDLGGDQLEQLLLWLLRGEFLEPAQFGGQMGSEATAISAWFTDYYSTGANEDGLLVLIQRLRARSYQDGTSRQLLFADVACAIARGRRVNSARYSLPRYSGLSSSEWEEYLRKDAGIKELWPAQHLLGRQGVFSGTSAIVQMPTSAGKTRGTELAVRCCFLSKRSALAVIVAPFRALCHEIRKNFVAAFAGEPVNIDELTDVTQADFNVAALLKGQQVLVVTPEKLLYVIRHNPELADSIGLIVYDEGHQFDSGTRGVTYELLLTSLKQLIPKAAQTVLISAVISNAESISGWLIGEDGVVVSGADTAPTYRSLAFATWGERLGQLQFVSPHSPDTQEFFVPRIIEELQLQLRKGERKERVFPSRADGQSVALFLGLKLVQSGSVAVFCGTKPSAMKMVETAVDAFERGVPLQTPMTCSDAREVARLTALHEKHLGADAVATRGAGVGIFSHHGNTPHGIRLCVEHALKEALACFVVCTSTLAQGVNLPIRYLVITSTYQGADRIKVRDFHNLIGRAGRAGMYTEGSVLFANPEVYDRRVADAWRWKSIKELLDPANSEPCASTLLSVFERFSSDDERYSIKMEPLEFTRLYINDLQGLLKRPERYARQHADKNFSEAGLSRQIAFKINIISAIESYLMANWDELGGMSEASVALLAEGTLAYYLATETYRDLLKKLFAMLADHVRSKVADSRRRQVFGKILYGVRDALAVEEWVTSNEAAIEAATTEEELLTALWPVISEHNGNSVFQRVRPPRVLLEFALGWINGERYRQLLGRLSAAGVRLGTGKAARFPHIDHAVDLGENAFGYEGMLAVGAVAEIYESLHPDATRSIVLLHSLQKAVKYGLLSSTAIIAYEAGFADRELAKELAKVTGDVTSRAQLLRRLRGRENQVGSLLSNYPNYFTSVFESLLQ